MFKRHPLRIVHNKKEFLDSHSCVPNFHTRKDLFSFLSPSPPKKKKLLKVVQFGLKGCLKLNPPPSSPPQFFKTFRLESRNS
jgi:hypothetical protein